MAVTVELALLSQVSYGSLEITGSRLQGLLALLAGAPQLGCSTSRLVDALWPDEQPVHPGKALQVLVSRARARLGPGVIVSTPGGYRLSRASPAAVTWRPWSRPPWASVRTAATRSAGPVPRRACPPGS